MCTKRKGNKIYLDQAVYLEKVLECFGMQNAKASKVLLVEGYNPSENKGEIDPKIHADYQSIIGLLLYLMLGTRPDICHAVTKLSQFAANPSQEHLDRAKSICCYLVGTKNYVLVYDGDSQKGIYAYTDSDWAANKIKCWSITGYFFKLANGIFSWHTHAQKTVALSSTEAEYLTVVDKPCG